MALTVKIDAPGGFVSENGYRRMFGLQVDFLTKSILFPVVDYRDKARRDDKPMDYVNNHAYQIRTIATKAGEGAEQLPDGKIKVIPIEGVPSYDEFMAQPISTYLAAVGPGTSIGDVFSAIAYGYAKTRIENRDAVDC